MEYEFRILECLGRTLNMAFVEVGRSVPWRRSAL